MITHYVFYLQKCGNFDIILLWRCNCIDINCTLKNGKPTLILESLNRDQKQNAENKLSALATDFSNFIGNIAAPKAAVNYNLAVA
jgi:hypothetical protein